MQVLPLDTIEYLTSLQGQVPNTEVGISFDGQRLAAIFYSIVDDLDSPYIEKHGSMVRDKKLLVWFAETFEPVGISSVYRTLDQILDLSTGLTSKEVRIHARGVPKGTWSFSQQSKANYGVRVVEFEKKSGGRWTPEEIASAVLDDLTEKKIEPAPEFKRRPEYELLNSELRNLKLVDTLEPLQEAALYGLGAWSALKTRAKYYVGPTNFTIH